MSSSLAIDAAFELVTDSEYKPDPKRKAAAHNESLAFLNAMNEYVANRAYSK